MPSARRNDLVMLGAGALLLLLDQLTKNWVVAYFSGGPEGYRPPVAVLGDMLQFEYDANKGVAFSLFFGSNIVFFFIALALAVIGFLYWRVRDTAGLGLKVAFGLILGGAVGNVLDRITRGFVVDFIHFQIRAIHFDFAVFNVADSGICIGVALLALLLWRGGEPKPAAERPSDTAAAADAGVAPAETPATSGSLPRVRRRVETTRS
jgi:signal peptidase II